MAGGVVAAIDIMSSLTNIISYAGFCLKKITSVVLALVANKLGSSMGIVLVGFLVAALLHLVNIVFCLFSPSIQSLRLHLVEFYSKFYEGGGRMYDPFKRGTTNNRTSRYISGKEPGSHE